MAKRKADRPPINNCVVISDTHFGCKVGLCPPSGFRSREGGVWKPGKIQRAIWKAWREFWDEWVPRATRGEPYVVVINGDIIDGSHHRAVSQFTQDIQEQRQLAVSVLEPELRGASEIYVTDGTEAHVGASSQDDRAVAEALGAVPDEAGSHSRGDLWLWLGGRRCLCHFAHHIGTTSSLSYESTAVNKEIEASLVEAMRWAKRGQVLSDGAPDVVIRSHRHRHIRTIIDGANGDIIGCVTPGWQGKTPFVYRIPGGRNTLPQIGGVVVRVGDEEHYVRAFTRTLPRSRPEFATAGGSRGGTR